ncbi:hypothetical protein AVEN_198170-1 [Araneus ventricosus]|uniref:Uncharacterized protein n=1 Tax=Araneus ventricosus TaxID=182803 RepID=A0A4Y2GHW9_ARAVE|nr:hypothetical protein AVEN_198170-1 [Araneus ventricosus]
MSYVTKITKLQEHYMNHKDFGIPYYEEVFLQNEYGLGGICLFRNALPFLMKALGKEALIPGTNVVNDAIPGEDIKIAAKRRSKEAGKILVI